MYYRNKPYRQDADVEYKTRERSFTQYHNAPNAPSSHKLQEKSFTQNHNAPNTPYSSYEPRGKSFTENHNVPYPSTNQKQGENLSHSITNPNPLT